MACERDGTPGSIGLRYVNCVTSILKDHRSSMAQALGSWPYQVSAFALSVPTCGSIQHSMHEG